MPLFPLLCEHFPVRIAYFDHEARSVRFDAANFNECAKQRDVRRCLVTPNEPHIASNPDYLWFCGRTGMHLTPRHSISELINNQGFIIVMHCSKVVDELHLLREFIAEVYDDKVSRGEW